MKTMTKQEILTVINAYQNHINDFVNVDFWDIKTIQEQVNK